MAHVTANTTRTQSGLAAFLAGFFETYKLRATKRRIYRETYRELAALSNRDLSDLGLARSEISRIAYQAANEI